MSARIFAIVPAAGGGARFGSGTPKQYALLDRVPLIVHTLDRIADALPLEMTVVVIAPDDARYEHAVGNRPAVEVLCCGGTTRAETVRNALAALAPRCGPDDWILVHDAARPCVPRAALARLVAAVWDDPVGGLLAVAVADTLKRAVPGPDPAVEAPRAIATEERAFLWQAQSPQMFRYAVLTEAFARDGALAATDEAQAVEALGHAPRLVRGSPANIKVTYAEDLAFAAAILAAQREEGG